jgi:hypothetical protein
MIPTNESPPKAYSPELLAALERAFERVWQTLHAHVPFKNEAAAKELSVTLSQTLVGLAAEGVIEPQELHRKALESMILKCR